MLFMVPFLLLLFSFLVLSNAGRNLKEKLTIFLLNPEDADKRSSGMITALRISLLDFPFSLRLDNYQPCQTQGIGYNRR